MSRILLNVLLSSSDHVQAQSKEQSTDNNVDFGSRKSWFHVIPLYVYKTGVCVYIRLYISIHSYTCEFDMAFGSLERAEVSGGGAGA